MSCQNTYQMYVITKRDIWLKPATKVTNKYRLEKQTLHDRKRELDQFLDPTDRPSDNGEGHWPISEYYYIWEG